MDNHMGFSDNLADAFRERLEKVMQEDHHVKQFDELKLTNDQMTELRTMGHLSLMGELVSRDLEFWSRAPYGLIGKIRCTVLYWQFKRSENMVVS